VAECGSHRLEMHCRAQRVRAHRGIDDVVQHLRGGRDHYNLVLEKRAVAVIRMPKFWIKDFVERARLECIRRGEPNHVAVEIAWHVIRMTGLLESARGQGLVNFFILSWR